MSGHRRWEWFLGWLHPSHTSEAALLMNSGFFTSLMALSQVTQSICLFLIPIYNTLNKVLLIFTGMIFCYYGLAGIVTLHHWFDKKISLAMAINFSGIAIGHFMWAPLTSWLVSLYTWRGALLILAAINLHCLILLYLLKTPEQYYGASYQKRHESIKSNTSQSPSKCIHKFIPNICQQPTYIAFHFLNVLFNMSYLVGMSYFPTRYVLTGGDKQTAAFLQALVGITMGILRPLHGLAADKIAKKRTCLFFIYEGLSGGALIMSALLDHFAWIAICAILFASFAGQCILQWAYWYHYGQK